MAIFIEDFSKGFVQWTGVVTDPGATAGTDTDHPDVGAYAAFFANVPQNMRNYCYKLGLTASPTMHHKARYQITALPAYGEVISLLGVGRNGQADSVIAVIVNSLGDGKNHWGLDVWIGGVEVTYLEAVASEPTIGIYDVEIVRDVTAGSASLWINGVLKLTVSGLAHVGDSNMIYEGIVASYCVAPQTVYVGKVVVDSAYIGTGEPTTYTVNYSSISVDGAPVSVPLSYDSQQLASGQSVQLPAGTITISVPSEVTA